MKKYLKTVVVVSFLIVGCTGTSPKLGVVSGVLNECPESPNCVNSQAKDEEHAIKPILMSAPTSEIKSKILHTIDLFDNSKVILSDSTYIRVEFTSSLFRFVDDVEFYFPKVNSKVQTIHLRSASRLGHSDLGVNRKRIEEFRNKLFQTKDVE